MSHVLSLCLPGASVQFSCSVVSWLFATPWIAARQAYLSITNSRSSLRFMSIKSVMPSSHLILGCPLLLLPPIPPSIRVFFNEPTLRMRWPKYWNFSFSIIPSKEIPGLNSFRMGWLDLLAVQGTLKSLLSVNSNWLNPFVFRPFISWCLSPVRFMHCIPEDVLIMNFWDKKVKAVICLI